MRRGRADVLMSDVDARIERIRAMLAVILAMVERMKP